MSSPTANSPENSVSTNTLAQSSLEIELENLKQGRKQLVELKGKLSRQIGGRKKLGEPFEEILTEMKKISVEIKQLDARQTEIKSSNCSLGANEKQTNDTPTLPLHIYKQEIFSSDRNNIVTIQYVKGKEWQQRWDCFVDQQPHACVYHRYEFKHVIEQSFGHDTLYLAAVDNDNTIQGILPAVHTRSRLFGSYITTMPFFNYGGPLAINPQIEESLVQALAREAEKRGAKHMEVRETQYRENYPVRTDKICMFLRLPNHPELLWQEIGSKLRAQIKKGKGNQLEFKTGGITLLDDFYRVFSVNMRDLGTPVYAKSFFHNLLQQDTLNSSLAVLYHQQQPVSCAFLLGFNDTMEIPWASTLRGANSLNANMVLYWNALSLAINSGYRYFDFGRSSKNASTYKFKKQWGAQPAQLHWHYWLADGKGELPQINPTNPKYQLLIQVWQRLPVVIANLLGPYIVRNLP